METIVDKRLPKAPWLWIQFHWFWFSQIIDAFVVPYSDFPPMFMKTRGSNFYQVWFGPITILWRRPWLRGPAKQHLKRYDECKLAEM